MRRLRFEVHPLTWAALAAFLLLGHALDAWLWILVLASHEIAHLVTAEVAGVDVEGVRVYPFGASLDMPHLARARPVVQAAVALAGPADNLFLLALALALGRIVPLQGAHLLEFARMNMAMAAVNLVPAYPLDGGRVAAALMPGDDRAAVTRRAAFLGMGVGAAIAAGSGVLLLAGYPAGGGAVLGLAVAWAARREAASFAMPSVAGSEFRRGELLDGEVLSTRGLVTMADAPLADVLAAFRPDLYHRVLVVDRDMALMGELTEEDLRRGLFRGGLAVPVGTLVRR